jgi:hypothetical protein
MNKILLLFIATSLAFSCEHDQLLDKQPVDEEPIEQIAGSWLYFEYGYSPGDKYYTVPVPPNPPGIITFKVDRTMSSINMALDKYKYYRILEDTLSSQQVLALFEVDPGDEPLDLAGLSPTYSFFWQGNHLTLNYRWCFEGCHMKFKRMASVEHE